MNFDYRNEDVEAALAGAASLEELEEALQRIVALQRTFKGSGLYGRSLFTAHLDTLIREVPRKLKLADVPAARSNDNPCLVSTEFYDFGGHTKVAREICDHLAESPPTVILTDVFNSRKHRYQVRERVNPLGWTRRTQLVLGADRLLDKIVELYNLMIAIRPTRIFMMTHHMDVVAQVALWPFRSIVDFVHHADYLPALGATLPFGRHVDLTWRCHLACRNAAFHPIYAGLETSMPPERPRPAASGADGMIRIATCATAPKYHGAQRHRWMDFAVAALADPRVEIVHIGPLDDELESDIAGALDRAAIDPGRYRFAGVVPDLPAALVSERADIYLASYPLTGGKANLEAMAAGLPLIVPVDPDTPDLLRFDLPIGGWVEIAEPVELGKAIETALTRSAADIATVRTQLMEEIGSFGRYVRGEPLIDRNISRKMD